MDEEELLRSKARFGTYNPVTVNHHNTVGAVILGLLSFVLLIGWWRAEIRVRELERQQG